MAILHLTVAFFLIVCDPASVLATAQIDGTERMYNGLTVLDELTKKSVFKSVTDRFEEADIRSNTVNLLKSLSSLIKYQNTVEDSVQQLVLEKLIEDACSLAKNALRDQSLDCTSENELDYIVHQATVYGSLGDLEYYFRREGTQFRSNPAEQLMWITENIPCTTRNNNITRNYLSSSSLFPNIGCSL